MTYAIIALVLVLGAGFVWLWWVRCERMAARRMVEEYVNRWPGGCPICAFRRFGILHGLQDPGSEAAPHVCPEAKR